MIRYCPTPAGRVAYAAAGSGPPLLCDVGWVSHVHRQLELFSFGAFMAGLAERFTVIRYDKPGCGLSDRDASDLSFETQVQVALAVADAAGAERFRLFGASHWPAALAVDLALLLMFAVQHSVMARPWFKRQWTRVVPPSAERAT